MQNLLIEEGSVISITNVSLPKATFVKLQPQHVDFLEITNPRAVLEHALRNFSCVTKGDVIQLPFNNKNYHFELKEVKPQDAACIIETDCNVDFDAPVGYKEPERNGGSGSINGGVGSSSMGGASGGVANDSLSSTLANIPKQKAVINDDDDGMNDKFNTTKNQNEQESNDDNSESNKMKIVDGKIIRPDDHDDNNLFKDEEDLMMASQTGGTGVQRNAAISVKAPEVNYWAVNAGEGARLDGKKPSILKDSDGKEVDIRKLRAEAAARRLQMQAKENGMSQMSSGGMMLNGKMAEGNSGNGETATSSSVSSLSDGSAANIPKRKSRVGSKFSKLKQSGGFAFQGSAKTFKK